MAEKLSKHWLVFLVCYSHKHLMKLIEIILEDIDQKHYLFDGQKMENEVQWWIRVRLGR